MSKIKIDVDQCVSCKRLTGNGLINNEDEKLFVCLNCRHKFEYLTTKGWFFYDLRSEVK